MISNQTEFRPNTMDFFKLNGQRPGQQVCLELPVRYHYKLKFRISPIVSLAINARVIQPKTFSDQSPKIRLSFQY